MPTSTITATSLVSEVRFRVNPDTGSDLDTRILLRLNWSIKNLVQLIRPPEFEATDETQALSSSSRVVTLPIDWLANITVKILSSSTVDADIVLDPIGENEESVADESETGLPRVYYRFAKQMRVFPLADSTYAGLYVRVRYLKAPPELVLSGATGTQVTVSPLPDYLDEALILSTSYRMLRDLEEVERATACFSQLRGILGSVINVRATEIAPHGMVSRVLIGDSNLI